nr:hypothetical protein [Tanacetum cinerariifolium]
LGSHSRIEESLGVQDTDKPKGNNVVVPSIVNMVKHNNSSRMMMLLGELTLEQLCTCVKIDVEDGGENLTVEQVRRRAEWDNDDYVCRGLILNAKYMAEDASSKKFLVSNFTNYKMNDLRQVLEQYNELFGILGSHSRIEESLGVQDTDKPKGNNVVVSSIFNMVKHNNSSRMMMLLGELTLEQLCMCVKIDVGSRPISR